MSKKSQQVEAFWASSKNSNDLISQAQQFLCTLETTNKTMISYYHHLRYFIQWCHEQQIHFPNEITTSQLQNYQAKVKTLKSSKSPHKPLSKDAKTRRIIHVKRFLKYLAKNNLATATFPEELTDEQKFWQEHHPNDLVSLAKKYLATITYSPVYIKGKRHYLRYFIQWCHKQSITHPSQVTAKHIDNYQTHTSYIKSHKNNETISFAEQKSRLMTVKKYFQWLKKRNYTTETIEIDYPKQQKKLPKRVLTHEEVKCILEQPDISNPQGIRDKAILETLYSTGIRRSELVNLDINDINFDRRSVHIRKGKNNKDRIIPIGKKAINAVAIYLAESRETYTPDAKEQALFLHKSGKRFPAKRLNEVVTKHIRDSGIASEGSCHLLRHAMAVALLNNGCEIRYIQELLGHAQLETTQIYTKVSINKLKQIHKQTHPAKMHPEKTLDILEELENNSPL